MTDDGKQSLGDLLAGKLAEAEARAKDAVQTEGERPPVADEELRMSFSGPALHANRIFASNLPAGMRIAFAEQNGDKVPPIFRNAVLLAYEDAAALRDLIDRQLSRMQMVRVEMTDEGPKVVSGD